MSPTNSAIIAEAARLLASAQETGEFIPPLREKFPGLPIEDAYSIQRFNTEAKLEQGRRIVGSKIGLTSAAVQQQLGVHEPDYGVLLDDMEYGEGLPIPMNRLQQPRIEAEMAFILGSDLTMPNPCIADVVRAIEYVVPALEIVGSRIKGWNIRLFDTIADNASSGGYVLGTPVRKLDGLDLRNSSMVLSASNNPEKILSAGVGANCLGNPLNAVVWLARVMQQKGSPLKAGFIVLSGALGPLVDVQPGETYTATIEGLGQVTASFDGV
jgi:2-keto-4-pentenoate hydratase